jgi:hypothetical protein
MDKGKDKVKFSSMGVGLEMGDRVWFLRRRVRPLLPLLLLLETRGRADGAIPILVTMGQAGATTMRRIIHERKGGKLC